MTGPVRAHHRYPWSLEEIASISVLALVPVVAWGLFAMGEFPEPKLPIFTSIFFWAAAFGLYRLGSSRKNKSAVEATVEDGCLTVTGFGLKETNTIKIEDVREIDTKPFGQTKAFVFSTSGDSPKSAVVPARVARQTKLRHLVDSVFEQSAYISKSARELRDEL